MSERPSWDDQFREDDDERAERFRKSNQRHAAQQKVDDWNAKHTVGAPVYVTLDGGKIVETVTRSAAEVLSGHSPVIWLDGITGCYLLTRVQPRPLP